MSILELTSEKSFYDAVDAPTLSVVHFFADWAEQCGAVTEVLKELTKLPEAQASQAKFYLLPGEKFSEISLKFGIDSVPTVIYFKNGKPIDKVEGADAAKITKVLKSHCQGQFSAAPKESLEDRLKALINKHPVMVFMKGNRDVPRCGFSRTLIQILVGTGVSFDTFDILSDEEVRQGLKLYSDWPTYPQLYVKGELVGGLDIIKELQASGELLETLNA